MRTILSILLVLLTTAAHAQVVLTPQLPPLGLTIKPQLWNLTLANPGTASLNVQLQMTMTDAGTGQTVLTGMTPLFPLPGGVKLLTINDVSPITYQVGAGYVIDAGVNGFLPPGVFNICYTLTKWTNDLSEDIADECVTVEVEPVSPPLLIQPADSERVAFQRPFFTWVPPTPFTAFSNLQYDWMLVEVQATQSASDAIQQNIPLLTQANLSFTSLQYPLSMPELDTAKIYAWRVTAKNNGMTVANSEINSFSIRLWELDSLQKTTQVMYSPLRREIDASYVICQGIQHYQYAHEQSDSLVTVQVTDLTDARRRTVDLDASEVKVRYGVNYLQLDLREAAMTNKHMYLLELVNGKGERWYLKFEYREMTSAE